MVDSAVWLPRHRWCCQHEPHPAVLAGTSAGSLGRKKTRGMSRGLQSTIVEEVEETSVRLHELLVRCNKFVLPKCKQLQQPRAYACHSARSRATRISAASRGSWRASAIRAASSRLRRKASQALRNRDLLGAAEAPVAFAAVLRGFSTPRPMASSDP